MAVYYRAAYKTTETQTTQKETAMPAQHSSRPVLGKYYNHDPRHFCFMRTMDNGPAIEDVSPMHCGDACVIVFIIFVLTAMFLLTQ